MERTVAPLNVSPLIKAARWGFLIAGVLYGSARYNRLCKKEQAMLAELERTREEREAKEKMQTEQRIKRELQELSDQLGVQI